MLTGLRILYDEAEDRLLIRTARSEGGKTAEHGLLLTRRICAGWRADLRVMLDTIDREPQSVFKQPGAELRARTAQSQGSVPRAAGDATPPGQEPDSSPPAPADQDRLLVIGISCARRRADGKWLIKFRLRNKPTLTLVLSDETLRRTAAALEEVLSKCNWALPPVQAARPAGRPRTPGPLH